MHFLSYTGRKKEKFYFIGAPVLDVYSQENLSSYNYKYN